MQGRDEIAFRDSLHTDYGLHLGDFIDGIDVIQPLDAVLVALMYGIDAQEAGSAIGSGYSSDSDFCWSRSGFLEVSSFALVGIRVSQVIEVAVGDCSQSRVSGIAEYQKGAFAQFSGSGSGQVAVQGIGLNQQSDIC